MLSEDCDQFLVKGNLSDDEFNEVLANYGYGPAEPETIKRGWYRCEQQGDNGGFDFVVQPTEPHARGAFEATWIAW